MSCSVPFFPIDHEAESTLIVIYQHELGQMAYLALCEGGLCVGGHGHHTKGERQQGRRPSPRQHILPCQVLAITGCLAGGWGSTGLLQPKSACTTA